MERTGTAALAFVGVFLSSKVAQALTSKVLSFVAFL